ncbi:MAG: hypothetical protein EOP04_04160 [Proteobacteria bacterium]|nr:MAG: hypothetical protein EOP04_04160 [Pseudomonadota bacterium]
MKNSLILALVLLLGVLPESSMAAKKKETLKKKPESTLGTSFKLDGSSLRGKYQSSMSTTATVENDKYMDDLLAGRKEFNDRLQQDSERN